MAFVLLNETFKSSCFVLLLCIVVARVLEVLEPSTRITLEIDSDICGFNHCDTLVTSNLSQISRLYSTVNY